MKSNRLVSTTLAAYLSRPHSDQKLEWEPTWQEVGAHGIIVGDHIVFSNRQAPKQRKPHNHPQKASNRWSWPQPSLIAITGTVGHVKLKTKPAKQKKRSEALIRPNSNQLKHVSDAEIIYPKNLNQWTVASCLPYLRTLK